MQKPISHLQRKLINSFLQNILIKPNILAAAASERQPEAAIEIWVKIFNYGPSKFVEDSL